jgi:hypothetical protein
VEGIVSEPPPEDILNLLLYLATDGVYFPTGWLFSSEAAKLSLNELGASRWMLIPLRGGSSGDGDGPSRPIPSLMTPWASSCRKSPSRYLHAETGQWYDTSRIEMIITNFLFCKMMVPWVLLYPWESGLSRGPAISKSAAESNCQMLASAFYLILRCLREELLVPPEDIDENRDDDPTPAPKDSNVVEEERNKRRGSRVSAVSNPLRRKRRSSSLAENLTSSLRQNKFVSNEVIALGLLPDSYFSPIMSHMGAWMGDLAVQLDAWIQEIVRGIALKLVLQAPKL